MSVLSVPYSFSPNTTASSSQVNANFNSVQTAVNNIDNTNIGGAGIYASQIIPGNTAQATFGGSQLYTIPAGLDVTGTIIATAGVSANGAYCTPLYGASGASLGATSKTVFGTVTFPGTTSVVVTLSGNAVFTGVNTYAVKCTAYNTAVEFYAYISSSTTFTIVTSTGGTSTAVVNWTATGY